MKRSLPCGQNPVLALSVEKVNANTDLIFL